MHSVTAACSNSLFTMTALPAEPGAPESCGQRLVVGGGDGSVSLFEGDGRSFRAAASLVVDGGVAAVQVPSIRQRRRDYRAVSPMREQKDQSGAESRANAAAARVDHSHRGAEPPPKHSERAL